MYSNDGLNDKDATRDKNDKGQTTIAAPVHPATVLVTKNLKHTERQESLIGYRRFL